MLLDKIIDYKKQELESLKRRISLSDQKKKAADREPARDFLASLNVPGMRVIAEIKKASPSAGLICADFDPVRIGCLYEEGGAACLSVLTDEHFFQGHLNFIESIKSSVSLPVLRKDFTLHEYQLYEARAAQADAVLLIVRILEDAQLRDYLSLAAELGMTALVEVHNADELERAAQVGAGLVGINNRDLDTLKIDLETSIELAELANNILSEALLVSESGISQPSQIKKLQSHGIRSFLIGESLMKSSNPAEALRLLLGQ